VAVAAILSVSTGALASGNAPVARWTIVAKLLQPAPKYASAQSTEAHGTIPLTWRGAASVLPVIRSTSTRLLVRVAQRPNGQTSWIPAGDATLSRTPYTIVIHLRSTRLLLFRNGRQILSTPIGVGTTTNPTPKGAYFVAFFAAPPSPDYGPFVIVTSAHSKTITDWDHSGDAMIGIHGPLGADAEIGTTGARISHGCIRLHVPALKQLRPVPAGSPVYVVP
jgi:lipoprotein-anchoring transpeptidase ErfK/SrfK